MGFADEESGDEWARRMGDTLSPRVSRASASIAPVVGWLRRAKRVRELGRFGRCSRGRAALGRDSAAASV